jgi:hypothetical protein
MAKAGKNRAADAIQPLAEGCSSCGKKRYHKTSQGHPVVEPDGDKRDEVQQIAIHNF